VSAPQAPRMSGRVNLIRGLVALLVLAATACTAVKNAPPEAALTTAEPAPTPASAPAPAPRPALPTPAAPRPTSAPVAAPAAEAATPAGDTQNSIEAPPATTASTTEIEPAAAEPPIVEPAAPVARGSEASDLGPASVASPPSAEALDLRSLVARLRKTKAINLMTKVAVKSQSDDLLAEFRAYHTQHGTATLVDLRRSSDLLFRKLHSLLQDADPPLDRDIDRSRAAIWAILVDPMKFRASNLMAGA
jgi:hypothetical protein